MNIKRFRGKELLGALMVLGLIFLGGCGLFFDEGDQVTGTISIEHNWPTAAVSSTPQEKVELTAPVREAEPGPRPGEYREGQMILQFLPVTLQAEKESIFEQLGVRVLDQIESMNAYLVETPQEKVEVGIASARSFSAITHAGPNYLARVATTSPITHAESNYQAGVATNVPQDTFYGYQWHYPQIRLPQAWSVTTGSPWVRIAVLDTGIDTGHPDLGQNIDDTSGYNFIDLNYNTNDWQGHGTHVAGTIGANTNNNLGVAGVMWNCSIIPVKVLGDDGYGGYWEIGKGIKYAAGLLSNPSIGQPAHIINMSLGGSSPDSFLKEAVESAAAAGVILVGATGNENDKVLYPAAYPEVIAVGAVDYNYPHTPQRAPYSNYGPEVDIVAPGGDLDKDTDGDSYYDGVLSTAFALNGVSKEYYYRFLEGTSMAAPHVSGVIGLMLSEGIPANQVRNILKKTSMDLGSPGFNHFFGHGLINAYWAVNNVQEIRVMVGEWVGNTFYIEEDGKIDLKAGSYSLSGVPAGNYRVLAWIDVRGNGIIEPGDYLAQSDLIQFTGGSIYTRNLILREQE